MKYLVKRPFPYSDDGIQATTLYVGEVHELRSDLAPGLLAEGFIERTEEDGEETPEGSDEDAAEAPKPKPKPKPKDQ